MEHRTDILLALQDTLTDLEREAFLNTFLRVNPRWKGADVADVLDTMLERDEHLELTEPTHEEFGKAVPEPRLLSACVITVYYITGAKTAQVPTWALVQGLVERVRAQTRSCVHPELEAITSGSVQLVTGVTHALPVADYFCPRCKRIVPR